MGTDSQNNVDFVLCVGWKTLGTGGSYCVLPSHLTQVRGLKETTHPLRKNYVDVSFFSFGLAKSYIINPSRVVEEILQ